MVNNQREAVANVLDFFRGQSMPIESTNARLVGVGANRNDALLVPDVIALAVPEWQSSGALQTKVPEPEAKAGSLQPGPDRQASDRMASGATFREASECVFQV